MNKKGTETELYMIIGGIIVAVILSIFVLDPFLGKSAHALTNSEDKPSTSTSSTFNNLVSSIENKGLQQYLTIEGNYGIVFFNKGDRLGLGGFERSSSCFDDNQTCICLCYIKELDSCSKKGNVRKTTCKELKVDAIDLIGFDDYIKSGNYKVLLESDEVADTELIRIIKENI